MGAQSVSTARPALSPPTTTDTTLHACWSADIAPLLTGGVELLASGLNLHDAQVHAFDFQGDGAFRVRALVGDLQVGYQFVELSYRDAELILEPGATVDSLELFAPRSEVIHDEVDVLPDGRFAHRVLLWPEGEYEIRFRGVGVRWSPATPRERR